MDDSRRVIWRYYAYKATLSHGLYLPVGLLYLQQQFGYGVVGLTQSVFALALVAGEVPTGYVGDRVGRRASLAIGSVITAAALAVFVFLDSAAEYVVLYAVWAIGWTFRSGTAEAWLYELLESRGEADEYARVSGRGNTVLLLTSAVGAAAAGVLVTVNWALPLLANAALAALAVPILYTLPSVADLGEDAGAEDGPGPATNEAFGVRDAVRTLRLQLGRADVRWVLAYLALFHGLFAITRPYESPIAKQVGVPVAVVGLLFAGFKLVSAGASASAGWFHDTFGTRGVLALLIPVYGVAYASVLLAPVLVVPVFFVNRAAKTVVTPVRNQYLNDRLGTVGRATVLSGASMALSVVSGTANLFSGVLLSALGPSAYIAGTGLAVAGAGGLLWLAVSPVRSPHEQSVRRSERADPE